MNATAKTLLQSEARWRRRQAADIRTLPAMNDEERADNEDRARVLEQQAQDLEAATT